MNTKAKLLKKSIELSQLPPLIPRPIAARFACVSPKTLARAEKAGHLTPIKRNQTNVAYDRGEFLRFLGIEPAAPIKTKKAG
jgi:hypothetical protein